VAWSRLPCRSVGAGQSHRWKKAKLFYTISIRFDSIRRLRLHLQAKERGGARVAGCPPCFCLLSAGTPNQRLTRVQYVRINNHALQWPPKTSISSGQRFARKNRASGSITGTHTAVRLCTCRHRPF
jgi:hypothetical protein